MSKIDTSWAGCYSKYANTSGSSVFVTQSPGPSSSIPSFVSEIPKGLCSSRQFLSVTSPLTKWSKCTIFIGTSRTSPRSQSNNNFFQDLPGPSVPFGAIQAPGSVEGHPFLLLPQVGLNPGAKALPKPTLTGWFHHVS